MNSKVKKIIGFFLVITILLLVDSYVLPYKVNAYSSEDAYINFDSNDKIWTIGTNLVEKKLQLNSSGQYLLTSFKNKSTNKEYIQGGQLSDEFVIQSEGEIYSGVNTGWIYDTHSISTLSQGELQLSVEFHNRVIKVTRNYVVYASTGIIQEWTVFQNISGANRDFSYPTIFRQKVMSNDINDLDFYYMTGNANFTGSGILKEIDVTPSYSRFFNSWDSPEVETVDGVWKNDLLDDKQGSAVYNQFFALRNRESSEGIFITFDFNGHWASTVGSTSDTYGGQFLFDASVQMKDYNVAPNDSITGAKSMTGVFTGDIDDMGNVILDYNYRYKWDYTRDDYFAAVKSTQWIRSNPSQVQTPGAFKQINSDRYLGMDLMWIDDNWFDKKGNWNNVVGDDFSKINQYANKSNIKMCVWMPPWHADLFSDVLNQHSDWKVNWDLGSYYGFHLNMAKPEVFNWASNLLNSKQNAWGAHMWRYDGHMSWPAILNSNDNLEQSNNFYKLLKKFKDDNPNAGIFGCSSGGESLSIESARYSDTQQSSDGNINHYDGYWNTLLTPPDKLTNSTFIGCPKLGTPYSKEWRGVLRESWTFEMNDVSSTISPEDKEALRKDIELYHYFKSKDVVGRWVKVYRPTLSVGDKTYFLQKMSGDNTKGYISMRPNNSLYNQNIIVYPKGLNVNDNYTITTLEGGHVQETRSGSYWMSTGISLTPLKAGEIIMLNLTDRPGAGTDTIEPSAPSELQKQSSTYLGYSGIELNWNPGNDDRWISYYEIFKNGESYDKVSKGTFYFDPNGEEGDSYGVRTVDGDGNVSSMINILGNKNEDIYTFSSGFSSTQGQNQWYYKEWNGSSYKDMTWQSNSGQWKGSNQYNLIWEPSQIHPSTTTDSVIAWKAPKSGVVRVSGNVKKVYSGGDGIKVRIMQNNTQVWPTSDWQSIGKNNITVGVNHDFTIGVAKDDMLYFVVNKGFLNNNYDETNWNPTVVYLEEAYALSSGISNIQGKNQWYYKERDGNVYGDMTWVSSSNQWKGSNQYNLIWAPSQIHPDSNDSVVAWKAPKSGVVRISGNVKKVNAGGDGVNVRILQGNTQVWPVSGWQAIGKNDTTVGVNHDFTINVTENDIIYFIVNKSGNINYDETKWSPIVTYNLN